MTGMASAAPSLGVMLASPLLAMFRYACTGGGLFVVAQLAIAVFVESFDPSRATGLDGFPLAGFAMSLLSVTLLGMPRLAMPLLACIALAMLFAAVMRLCIPLGFALFASRLSRFGIGGLGIRSLGVGRRLRCVVGHGRQAAAH